MYEFSKDEIAQEHKILTKCIFQGLTIAQIAQKMHCSQSTVSNRMSDLYEKYNAKTKFEFVLGVLGEIVRNNKLNLEESESKIEDLSEQVDNLTLILKNIILNMSDKKSFDYWIKQAKEKLF